MNLVKEDEDTVKSESEKDSGTFVVKILNRQNSTWQGEFFQMETGKKEKFSNMVDFIKKLDQAIE